MNVERQRFDEAQQRWREREEEMKDLLAKAKEMIVVAIKDQHRQDTVARTVIADLQNQVADLQRRRQSGS